MKWGEAMEQSRERKTSEGKMQVEAGILLHPLESIMFLLTLYKGKHCQK